MNINKERFEAWLLSQPDDRTWNYSDITGCVMCQFIRETSNFPLMSVAGTYFRDRDLNMHPLPSWFGGVDGYDQKLMHVGVIGETGTYATLKDRWRKLNPDEAGQDLPQNQVAEKPAKPLCSP